MSSSNIMVLFIGYNHGEFGVGSMDTIYSVNKPIKCLNPKISKHFHRKLYNLFDDNYQNIWSAGHNQQGQCGTCSGNKLTNIIQRKKK